MSCLTRSAGRDLGPISMIHFSRPSSSQVPPHPSQVSTGTLRYFPSAIAPPQPEQYIGSPPGAVFIYDQKPCPATLFRNLPGEQEMTTHAGGVRGGGRRFSLPDAGGGDTILAPGA